MHFIRYWDFKSKRNFGDQQIQSTVEHDRKKKNRVCFKSDPPEVKIIENRKIGDNQDEKLTTQQSNEGDPTEEILDPETEKEFEDLLNIEPEISEDNIEVKLIQSENLGNGNATIEKETSQSEGGNNQTKMHMTEKKKKKKKKK